MSGEPVNLLYKLLLLGLVLLRQHIEIVLHDAFRRPVHIHLGEQPVHLCLAFLRFFQLRCLSFGSGYPFSVSGLQNLVKQLLFIHLCLCRPILNTGKHIAIKHIIADVVRKTAVFGHTELTVGSAVEIAVRRFVLLVGGEAETPSAIRTFRQSRKNLCRCITHLSAAAGDLPLHLFKDFLGNDSFVGIFYPQPFFRGLSHLFLVLVGNIALLVVNAVADIGFIFQNTLDLCNRPRIRLFLRLVLVDVSKGSVRLLFLSELW